MQQTYKLFKDVDIYSLSYLPTYLKKNRRFFKYRQITNVATFVAESIMNSCPLIEDIDVWLPRHAEQATLVAWFPRIAEEEEHLKAVEQIETNVQYDYAYHVLCYWSF